MNQNTKINQKYSVWEKNYLKKANHKGNFFFKAVVYIVALLQCHR